jgi:Transposase IS4
MSGARPTRVRAAPARFDEEQASLCALAAAAAAESAPRPSVLYDVQEDSSSDEEEEEEEKKGDASVVVAENNTWSSSYSDFSPADFNARHHPLPSPAECDTPLDFFHLFCPPSFLSDVVAFSNTYAQQRHDENKENEAGHARSSAAEGEPAVQWQPTTEEEVSALLGCLIYMGIVCMNDPRGYWEETTQQSFVSSTFPRDRFFALLRSLRFNAEADDDEGERNPLHQLCPLMDHIHAASQKYFAPGKYQSLDEAMIAFKGRSNMRQHIAKKKSPTGFKVWMLIDCATNFVVAFDVYTGAKGKPREENASANVVLQLVRKGLQQKHHVLVMDGFFTSVHLMKELLAVDQYALGTTRINRRGFPKKTLLSDAEGMARGEWKWRQHREKREICIASWMDKKPVNLISTCCNPTKESHIPRRQGWEKINVKCPEVLPLYTRYLRGVDVFAQRHSYSKIGRKSRKFFYSLIWFLVDVAIHNAFLLHLMKHRLRNYDEKAFRQQLMQQLVGTFSARKKVMGQPKRPRDALHCIVHTEQRGPCQQCRTRVGHGDHNRRSHWCCDDCQVFLCMPECYNKHIQALAEQRADVIEA